MTTLAPVVDAVADVKAFGLFAYRGALWSIYVRESGEVPCADGFVRWVKANEPDILRVLKEPALNAVANALAHETARGHRSATS